MKDYRDWRTPRPEPTHEDLPRQDLTAPADEQDTKKEDQ